jgi:exodeoxyribonuclease VII large subunit
LPSRPSNEFPDLFDEPKPERTEREIWSVTKLTAHIKRLLEDSLPLLWVEGEISNYKAHSSGHRYFTLKDESAQLASVIWRTRSLPAGVTLQDGMKIRAYGRITVYEQAGRYQFDVQSVLPVGIGSLQAAFEKLRQKLADEGLFEPGRKRLLPRFPTRIGLITSPTGAVLHDLAWGFSTRYPPADIMLIPVAVQGEGAAAQVVEAIQTYNRYRLVDLIVIARGGGSLEDLWAFNEESLVRAVAASGIPTVSAVGHEVDVTLCDLAADVRAPTPTGAAAIVVPDRKDLIEDLDRRKEHLHRQLERYTVLWRERLEKVSRSHGFVRVPGRISEERQRLDDRAALIDERWTRFIENKRRLLSEREGLFSALSPLAVLSRGYSITRRENGVMVRNSNEISPGEPLWLTFSKGTATARVEQISHE